MGGDKTLLQVNSLPSRAGSQRRVTPEGRAKAVRYVASQAEDVADLAALLDALGLLPERARHLLPPLPRLRTERPDRAADGSAP